MRDISILIKPASSLCNFRCRYCFYHDVSDLRDIKSFGIMRKETVDNLVTKSLEEAIHSVTFAFQGGEPTLAGLDFFRYFTSTVEKHNHKNVKINYAIQTNGSLLDDDMAKFLKKYHFLVGLSFDGPKEIHDYYRLDTSKNGTFKHILKTKDLLNKYQVEYNILCVVSATVAKKLQVFITFLNKMASNIFNLYPV